ncbi:MULTISPECIES: hypothetical protein [unclassified Halomonas]|uniref:hypothetical protein n=1 Tax=unclassified Halomonas TaxID=2609666 RepID=UPI0028858019|nr:MULTISPECIES: hypothetical protein [unclassified Halomonas]MDT0499672.1 hypothetical protein [Halomonas sp. PAR7]MDT0510511.1 hypothetical protein [Halomonas sp. LES1]MDT0592690.1 hypothetical protein [Halomonas sp. PAR8]
MIRRMYFYSASRWREDGRGEAWQYGVMTLRSWLPRPLEAYEMCREKAKAVLDERQPGNTQPLRMLAFNRMK